MIYRINQLQISGPSGCVTATALNRPTIGRAGVLVLAISEKTAILTAEDATKLAQFLIAFDPEHKLSDPQD